MSKEPSAEEIVAVTLAASEQSQLRSYLDRGRIHRTLGDDALQALFVQLMREWGASDKPAPLEYHDVDAEYRIRRQEPPFDLVKPEIEMLVTRAGRIYDNLDAADVDRINCDLLQEYVDALKQRQ